MPCWRTSMSSELHSILFQNVNIYWLCVTALREEKHSTTQPTAVDWCKKEKFHFLTKCVWAVNKHLLRFVFCLLHLIEESKCQTDFSQKSALCDFTGATSAVLLHCSKVFRKPKSTTCSVSTLHIVHARSMHSDSVVEKYRSNIRQNVTLQNKCFLRQNTLMCVFVWASWFYSEIITKNTRM